MMSEFPGARGDFSTTCFHDSQAITPGSELLTIIVAGPTGVGKSSFALCLARYLGGEIISADAFQFYRGLDIGTDKPSAREMSRVRHHFIDCLSPAERADAQWFSDRARKLICQLWHEGRVPIVCGGSGLYLRSLVDGFFDQPAPEAVMKERARVGEMTPEQVNEKLARLDPSSALRLHQNDIYRRRRALEVSLAAGRPFSQLRGPGRPIGGRVMYFVLYRGREELHDRINRRVDQMFERGLEKEVADLAGSYDFSRPAFAAIGYRETAELLSGKRSREETVEIIKRKTRQYARRQMTWFRGEKRAAWLDLSGRDQGYRGLF